MPETNSKKISAKAQANHPGKLTRKFERWADRVSDVVGSPWWFAFSVFIIIVWIPSGFFLGFGEIWHLLINTTTTIFTFLMMALLHSSQSKWERRMERLQVKEKSEIIAIKQDTEKIAGGVSKDSKKPEKINSLH